MRDLYEKWIRTPSLRGQLIWLNVSSVLVTLLISLLILVLLVINVMGSFVNREAQFAMHAVSQSLSTKTQMLEDMLLRICKHRLTRAHREKQLKMSCQALHNAPPNRT